MQYRWMVMVVIVVMVSGCQGRTTEPALIDGRFDVGGFSLYLHCLDQRPHPNTHPTVVLEHGIGQRATSEMWVAVERQVASFARVCRYDRAGVGHSDPPVKHHRTGKDLVDEAHRLLEAAGIDGPYVLVGHSFGGYPVRVFAQHYPTEVVGIVLADTPHEDMISEIPLDPESLDAAAIGAEVRAARSLGDRPVVVITRGQDRSERWEAFQHDLLTLSTNHQQIIAETSDHQIPINQPEVIVLGIQQVIDAVQTTTSSR